MNRSRKFVVGLLFSVIPLACSPPEGAFIDHPDTVDDQDISNQDTGHSGDPDASSEDPSESLEPPDVDGPDTGEGPADTGLPDAGEEPPISCDGRQPGGMIRTPDCLVGSPAVDCFDYTALYGAEFPGLARGRQIYTKRDEYIALEFTVPQLSTSATGGWGYVVPQITPTYTGRNMQSISRCPGDFDEEQIRAEMGENCYIKQSANPPVITVQWAIEGGSSTTGCILTPGETYYYNIVYTSSPAGTAPEDIQWQCGNYLEADVCSNNTESIF